jgi:hypothetical protein
MVWFLKSHPDRAGDVLGDIPSAVKIADGIEDMKFDLRKTLPIPRSPPFIIAGCPDAKNFWYSASSVCSLTTLVGGAIIAPRWFHWFRRDASWRGKTLAATWLGETGKIADENCGLHLAGRDCREA